MNTSPLRRLLAGFLIASASMHAIGAPETLPVPSQAQLDQIAAMLPRDPQGVGRPITDRAAWAQAASQPAFQKELKDADTFLTQPAPVLTNALFHEVLTTGARDTYEKPFRLRTTRLVAFVVAECIQDQGKYLSAIESELNDILSEPSWAAPAHVLLSNPYGGIDRSIELATAARAWTVATADYWLGDKLKPETRLRIRTELRRRVFDNYEDAVLSGKPHWWWMTAGMNWNPVCNSGVVGAALAILPSAKERAIFIAGAQTYLPFYLAGFPDEGFDSEGLGYWAYGFGCYLCLAETIYEATQGRINLFAGDKIRQIALFPSHFEIIDGVFPAFGDSGVVSAHGLDKAVGMALPIFINQRWGMGWTGLDLAKNEMYAPHGLGDRLAGFGLFGFPLPVYGGSMVAGSSAPKTNDADSALRFYFKDLSVMITRSARSGAARFGLALKGGHNGGNHGHNDNGTYVVVCNGEALLVDPGTEVYTAKSFGPHRFESMMMNSYGHDVPLVGGQLQAGGKQALGKIIRTDFTADKDTLVMDLTTSYPVPGVKKVIRTYVLDRTALSITITDEAEFDQPTAFGSALVTISDWKEEGPGSFLVYDKKAAVHVTVTTDGGKIDNKVEPITGFQLPAKLNPHRLGVNVDKPSTHVVMRTVIVSATVPGT